jgi:lipopolysaccharide transport system ATP-binding protein
MSDVAIEVDNLGKMYRLGGRPERYRRFTETVMDVLTAPARRLRTLGQPPLPEQTLWALKNLSFEVKQGEVVGIIGRNGAGKSTLLKILSRITEPTEGEARVYGRVGSLLEVGTGFHPELTGRENIYLNGAILGMRRAEIARKFDEMVAFAEIEKFIDTPVKRYSSGMYVRLAFAVAAHLEPEILVVDEVLAVGDASFQRKCLGKMEDVARGGRTVLFVSHNMAAIENLCQRGVVLDQGRVEFIGSQTEAIAGYLKKLGEKSDSLRTLQRGGSGQVKIVDIEFRNSQGQLLEAVQSGQDMEVYLHYETGPNYLGGQAHVGIMVNTQLGIKVFSQSTRINNINFSSLPPSGNFVCRISKLPLPAAVYRLGFAVKVDETYADFIEEAVELTVIEGDFFGSGQAPSIGLGVCLVDGKWSLEVPNPTTHQDIK